MTQTFRRTGAMRLGTALMTGLLRAGIPMGPLVLLSVPGRKSGKVFTTPVALVQHGNERWLVAAFGEVNWVRNLRAAGMAQFTRGWHTEAIGVAELEAQEAAPILKQYLKASQRVSFIKPYFHVTPHSSLADFVQAAAHHPVFRVVRKDVME